MMKETEKAIEQLVNATLNAIGDEVNERQLPIVVMGMFVLTSDGDSMYMSCARGGVENKRALEVTCLESTLKRILHEA